MIMMTVVHSNLIVYSAFIFFFGCSLILTEILFKIFSFFDFFFDFSSYLGKKVICFFYIIFLVFFSFLLFWSAWTFIPEKNIFYLFRVTVEEDWDHWDYIKPFIESIFSFFDFFYYIDYSLLKKILLIFFVISLKILTFLFNWFFWFFFIFFISVFFVKKGGITIFSFFTLFWIYLNFLAVYPFLTGILSYPFFLFSLSTAIVFTSIFFSFLRFESSISHLYQINGGKLAPSLIIIELAGVIIRPLTLTVRMFANLGTGHLLRRRITFNLFCSSYCFIWEVWERAVCIIQSIVFVLLVKSYWEA